MKQFLRLLLFSLLAFNGLMAPAQDTAAAPFQWTVRSKKLDGQTYQLLFQTPGNPAWELYAPQLISEAPTTELQFPDTAIRLQNGIGASPAPQKKNSPIFGVPVLIQEAGITWTAVIRVSGTVPAVLQGSLLYSYGKGEEYYPSTVFPFTVPLEGGVSESWSLLRTSIDVDHPVSDCGDDKPTSNILRLLLIGLSAGFLSLFFPCIFPLIPLTVSYFTKRSGNRKQGIRNAVLYGFSIFFIFVLLSLPFHLFSLNPEILNNISTNVPLNLIFFVVFIVFALSFFGLFEIVLPAGLATKADAKSNLGNFAGIFFMALTLVIVSFSCTAPILGSLIFGATGGQGGAWQLTAAMAGFGLGLGLPFVLFALFPHWLQSLPKSGGWMTELKVVFGFIELAMAIKFLSSADLVMQWGLLKREVFIGIWAVIGLLTTLYLCGFLRSKKGARIRFTRTRVFFILLFGLTTLYLLPGVLNSRWANLTLVSGLAPAASYSVYKHPVLVSDRIHPLENDYQKALQLAREQGKPVLIDFTGWACVNCRRMEDQVWIDPEVKQLMKDSFVVVSLYVDERRSLPVPQRQQYRAKNGQARSIVTVGDKWATFQSENFHAVSQPQYAIVSPAEQALTKTKGYTTTQEFANWLRCGLDAHKRTTVR